MLNGKQLVDQAGKLKTKPLVVGNKLVSRPADAEMIRLLEVQKSFKDVASLERINRLDSRSIGHFEHQKVRIEKFSGKSHRLVGHTVNNVHFLEPHEALYLMEINELVVYFDATVISIEQGYHLFLDTPESLSTECYFAFTHLMRSGYYVRRHKHIHASATDRLDEKQKILINLKQNLNYINQKDVLKYAQNEEIQQEFLRTRDAFLRGESDPQPRSKKQRFEPFTQFKRCFPESNPSDCFSNLFQELIIVGDFEGENVSNVTFDFDIFPSESRNCTKKLAESPKYYAKVIHYSDEVKNETLRALVKKSLGTEVLIVIVFENLSIASYVCE